MTQINGPVELIIFGASGDLSQRKLFPALFNLAVQGKLPEQLKIFGASRRPWSSDDFRREVAGYLQTFATSQFAANQPAWQEWREKLQFVTVNFDQAADFTNLKAALNPEAAKIIYYAVSPEFFAPITKNIGSTDLLSEQCATCRVVVEKPFGHDLASAQALEQELGAVFKEEQIYRIDHILSKNALADVYGFRKSNYIFNELFKGQHVDHIQISYAEDIGIEGRGEFYEQAGALRDMVQGHILEALSLLLAELPSTDDYQAFQQARAQVIAGLKLAGSEAIVLGQYGEAEARGEKLPAYRQEQDVAPDSEVETFVALKLISNLPLWQDTPIYLRTGKRLSSKYLDLHLVFKDKPQVADEPNILSFRISPNAGVNFRIFAPSVLGDANSVRTVDLTHCYKNGQTVDAYENLLGEIFLGRKLFFVGIDEIYHSWKLIDQIRQHYSSSKPIPYPAGSEGPEASYKLIEQDQRRWLGNTISDFCRI